VINAYLSPYALRYAAELAKIQSCYKINQEILNQKYFSCAQIGPKSKNFHTFGCPAFVFDHHIQATQKIVKWSVRSKIGVFLKMPQRYARIVGLILNIHTGHVSLQIHWTADLTFTTFMRKFGIVSPISQWQQAAGLFKVRG
jgi:hypothetical protein